MKDPTEKLRREMLARNQPAQDLEKATQRWTTEELKRDFVVTSFLAPFVFATRKKDGVKGALEFTHSPRVYFNWSPLDKAKDKP
jgi:hypothetical protein